MKYILSIFTGLLLSACLISPQSRTEASRPFDTDYSDPESLEMLLQEEQQLLYGKQETRNDDQVRIGMAKKRVKITLGHPDQVEVAGNPKYGNERWIYVRSIPTTNGYYQEQQVIYFEGGSVVGWESR